MNIKIIRIYYLATPVFFILYYYFDINLRVSIPGAGVYWFYLYYLSCFIASFVVFKNITIGSLFSLVESSINIFLLILSIYLPVINIGQNVENVNPGIGFSELIHFIIAGFILIQSFYLNPIIIKNRDI